MDQVNLKKLAQALNLAPSTVSRALSDSYEISAATKARVLEMAQQLNYQPNPYARSLRKRSSYTIAVIVPEVANNFFSLVINGIEEIAQAKGYHVLIYITHENYAKEAAFIKHLLNGRVDGILMSLSGETQDLSHIYELKQHNLPVVFFDRICEEMETVKVTTNDYESGQLATRHLLEKGCRDIAYLAASGHLSTDKLRLQGYADALRESGKTVPDNRTLLFSADQEANKQALRKLLMSPSRPDGIFAAAESLAILSYEVCKELGIIIPDQMKVISFSNLRTASLLNPSLTTITQPAFDIGKEAATALFHAIGKNKARPENRKIILSSTLIERDSTASSPNLI